MKCFFGYTLDNKKLLESASGGFATAVSEEFIKNGGVVIGVSYSKDYKRAEFRAASTIEDLKFLKGSKYFETDKIVCIGNERSSLYQKIIDLLKNNKKVLLIGMGCDLFATLNACKSRNVDISNLYLIDLLCHGPTYRKVHEDFIISLEKAHRSKIKDFTVRYKKDCWTVPYLRCEFENGEIYLEKFYETDYGYAFMHYSKDGCYKCPFKDKNHNSNLTIGDYWGIQSDMEGYNKDGVSIIFVHDKKGEYLLSLIKKENFYLHETVMDMATQNNPTFYRMRLKSDKWQIIDDNIKKRGLHKSVLIAKLGYKEGKIAIFKENKFIRKVLRYTPSFVKNAIKKVMK